MQTETTTKFDIVKMLNDRLAIEKADLAAHMAVKEGLKQVDGKPINKRILSKLPEGSELDIRYGMFHIKLNDRSHLIGYNSDPFVNSEKFDDFDSCYCAGSFGRASQIDGFLNNPSKLEALEDIFSRLANTFEAFKNTVQELETSKFESYYNPLYYELLKVAGVPPSLVSDIRFDKLKMAN